MMPEIVTFDGRRYALPFADLPRAMTDAERDSLDRSLSIVGQIFPIILDDDTLDPIEVLDGADRLRMAIAKNSPACEVSFRAVGPMTWEQKAELVKWLALAKKNFDADADRRALFDKLRELGLSRRAAAKGAGLNRNAGQRSGDSRESPERCTGSDGKGYPARQVTQKELAARQSEVQTRTDQGESLREIAAAMGISTGTVSSDLAALRLARELKDAGEEAVESLPREARYRAALERLRDDCYSLDRAVILSICQEALAET
jgi:DNA-binding CsgD family transcriptional regulator